MMTASNALDQLAEVRCLPPFHLTTGQRGIIAAKLATMKKGQHYQARTSNHQICVFDAAKALKVSTGVDPARWRGRA
jgi:hypothetical protein